MDETVKFEVELPKNLSEALRIFCIKFEYDGNEVIEDALTGFFEARMADNYEQYLDRIRGTIERLLEGDK